MSTERGQPHAAIVTAAFSIATAYGAAIALVTPKDKQAPDVVLTPFIALAVAVTIAMVGKAAGISLGAGPHCRRGPRQHPHSGAKKACC